MASRSWLAFIERQVDVWEDVWTDRPMGRCHQGTGHVAMSKMSVLNSPTAWLGRDNELIPSVPGGDENKPEQARPVERKGWAGVRGCWESLVV